MTTLAAQPSWDLATLNTFVAQQENFLQGPLINIGNDDTNTTIEIDDTKTKPAKNAMITTGTPPSGSTKIGSGQVFISGKIVSATAYRPA